MGRVLRTATLMSRLLFFDMPSSPNLLSSASACKLKIPPDKQAKVATAARSDSRMPLTVLAYRSFCPSAPSSSCDAASPLRRASADADLFKLRLLHALPDSIRLSADQEAKIKALVDAYNAVSLAHVMPLGADDLEKVAGDLAFRYSRLGDQFLDMAGGEGESAETDPPKEGEIVYADGEKILCRRWNWRQDMRSLVTPLTRRAVVTVQSNGVGELESAAADLRDLLKRFAGARTSVTIADRLRPLARLA